MASSKYTDFNTTARQNRKKVIKDRNFEGRKGSTRRFFTAAMEVEAELKMFIGFSSSRTRRLAIFQRRRRRRRFVEDEWLCWWEEPDTGTTQGWETRLLMI